MDSSPSPPPSEHQPDSPYRHRARNNRTWYNINDDDSNAQLLASVLRVFALMESLHLDLALLLWAISWHAPEVSSDLRVSFHRTVLLGSDLLPAILTNWHRRPTRRNAGISSRHEGSAALEEFAISTVERLENEEIRALFPLLKSKFCDLDRASVLSLDIPTLLSKVRDTAPTCWRIRRSAAWTDLQEEHALIKTPDFVSNAAPPITRATLTRCATQAVLFQIATAVFLRSPSHGLLHRDLTLYLRAQGCTAKVYDTTHRFGISFCQKQMYRMTEKVGDSASRDMKARIRSYLWFGGYDNLSRENVKQEERLDNKTTFDVGTTSTLYIVNDPDQPKPDLDAYIKQCAVGMNDPITAKDILELERLAAPDLRARAVHRVLQFLTDALEFDLATYPARAHSVFDALAPVDQMSHARTEQYMVETIHQEQSSYEGNDIVIDSFVARCDVLTPDDHKAFFANVFLALVGDQLTTARIRGLRQFRAGESNASERMDNTREVSGWMHQHMHLGKNFFAQHLGTTATFGLKHSIDFWDRKGLNTPSTQGTFYSRLEDAILHTASAHMRAAWLHVSGAASLAELRSHTPDQLLEYAQRIVREHASNDALLAFDAKHKSARNEYQRPIIMFNRDALDWLILGRAMKTGDVGLMERFIPRNLLRFAGGGNTNYVTELLELLQGLQREWPADVR
jgi:hypothetical protein